MTPSRRPRPRTRRPAATRASSTRRAVTDPTRLLDRDETRYLLSKTLSAAEIAARENSTVAAVEASIARVRLVRERFSEESLQHTIRRGAILAQPAAQAAILEALGAKISQIREVGTDDSGKPITEIFSFPDHKTRMQAIDRLTSLVTSIQQQSPLVNIDARTATQNNLHLLPTGQAATTEDIIRAVRVEKGLALAAETGGESEDTMPLSEPIDKDFELEADLQKAAEIDPEYLAEPEEPTESEAD